MLKISKSTSKTITASEEICTYSDAIQHIKQAIDALGPCAASDSKAKDAIADLAVVYAYLRGNE